MDIFGGSLIGWKDADGWAREILRLASRIQLEDTTPDQRDQIQRSCAKIMSRILEYNYKSHGMKIRPDWDKRGPHAKSPNGHYEIFREGYHDHLKRYIGYGSDKRNFYVSEPYDIGNDGIKALAKLADEGWDIWITGRSTHFPGSTVAVLINKKAAKP